MEQVAYHIRLLHQFEHILLCGFHIEEMIYGPKYYYPELGIDEAGKARHTREYEVEEGGIPKDTILVHMTARPDVILRRMEEAPHPHTLIQREDVPELLDAFKREFDQSWMANKLCDAAVV